jgi:hypothetical protein
MAHPTGEHDAEQGHDEEHDEIQECIEACLNAHAVSTMTAQYCLTQGGEHADVSTVGLLLDCAELCQLSANFMLRGSPYHAITCDACAELCRACEEACRGFTNDEHMEHCAEVCAACAESCERMAASEVSDDDE